MQMAITLDDKYTAERGSVLLTGTQALVRLPMTQMRRDRASGLNTAGFISGYRGSPLGGYDQQLVKARKFLGRHEVVFQPGLNEDLAATAVWGSQQLHLSPGARKDGILGIWYGKGPGVDRSGDVFKHANAAGSARHGGVLAIAGDDHTCKSSSIPHQSDHAFISALMPMLYPSSVHEFLEMGLLGIAMSRYSGCWVGFKVISETVEITSVVDLAQEARQFVLPTDFELPQDGLNLRWPDPPLVQDERLQEHKGYAAIAFARANGVDRLIIDHARARFGIVASGKAYEDVRQALAELGLGAPEQALIGLRLYKVRMPWPLEPEGIRAFSQGLEEVLIVEERREIIENQIKEQLFNWRADVRPRIGGKFDEAGQPFLSLSAGLSVGSGAGAIAERLRR
ncbi:MAG: indolepyruvate ferredoxin oxidoreductase family protein, partial [Cypionkella sp.]|nr:indolepyruvate ferredoxin oxidoreductase family protein [Cypionkella sp.]